VAFLVARKIESTDRILSLLAPDDLRGLTTGLVASLITGATLESHGLVDGGSLSSACETETPTHLVAPGWMEPVLARANLPAHIVSTTLVHDAPVRFKARGELKRPVTDVLGFGEVALVSRSRSDSGHLMLSLENEDWGNGAGTLLRIRRNEDGTIHFGGTAAEVYDFSRGTTLLPAQTNMNGFQKVLVVDNGERALDSALSAELAGMGLASVTTSFEAADDVLALIPSPSAVVLQMPRNASWSDRQRFLALAERLKTTLKSSGIPVIVTGADGQGAHASLLQSELGTRILSQANL
jgi:hypothetical protein